VPGILLQFKSTTLQGFYKDYKMLEELAEKEGRQWEKKN